jgi:hypothetical protein
MIIVGCDFHLGIQQLAHLVNEDTPMKKKQTTAKKAKSKKLKIKAASRKRVAPVPRTVGEDIDGCDVAVTNATLDHDLPAAKGGVA